MSRQRAKGLIEGDKVKLNWETFAKPDFTVGLMDVVSVRGFGRIQITDLAGQTKKGRIKLAVNVLRK
jgi:RNA-binding protein YlmH